MLDTRLKKTGSILMHDGKISLEGFEADGCMCREVAIHALLWAIGELQRELAEEIHQPGGSGNVSIDFGPKLCKALGIEHNWY